MTVGLAGVAGTILAAYASMGIRIDYLVAAAFMSAPGGIFMAKMIMPDPRPNLLPGPAVSDLEVHEGTQPPAGAAAAALNRTDVTHLPGVHVDEPVAAEHEEEKPANIIMAASQGAQTGVKLAVAVGAMVLAFVALIALANGFVGWAAGSLSNLMSAALAGLFLTVT
jgi:CNT family concentrative nucleoside transporter